MVHAFPLIMKNSHYHHLILVFLIAFLQAFLWAFLLMLILILNLTCYLCFLHLKMHQESLCFRLYLSSLLSSLLFWNLHYLNHQ